MKDYHIVYKHNKHTKICEGINITKRSPLEALKEFKGNYPKKIFISMVDKGEM